MTAHLQAALAFALTMMALATVVTVVMEILIRFFHRRSRHLHHMLKLVYESHIAPHLKEAASALRADVKRLKSDISTETINTVVEGRLWVQRLKLLASYRNDADARAILSRLFRGWKLDAAKGSGSSFAEVKHRTLSEDLVAASGRPHEERLAERFAERFAERVARSPFQPASYSWWSSAVSKVANILGANTSSEISREDFVRRLARDDVGRALREQAGLDTNTVINDIALRFDEVSDAAREYFVNSNRVISVVIGILLALVFNIDGFRIYSDFIDDPAKAERFIEQAEEYKQAFVQAQSQLNQALAEKTTINADTDPVVDLQEAISKAQAGLSDLTAQGIAIGWGFPPHCKLRGNGSCENGDQDKVDLVIWILSAILTGILVGLGGPFWYDVVTGLTRATQILRGRTSKDTTVTDPATLPEKSALATEIFNDHVGVAGEAQSSRNVLKRQLQRLKEKIEAETGSVLPAFASAQPPPNNLRWGTGAPPTGKARKRTESRYRRYKETYREFHAL